MTDVLVTGAAGAIGCHLVRRILETTDWRITIADSYRHGGRLERIDVATAGHDPRRVRNLRVDLADPTPHAFDLFGRPEHIIHLAALSDVTDSVRYPRRVIDNNLRSTLNLLDWAAGYDHATFVQFSTDEVYGDVYPGDWRGPWDPHRPSNPYAASKAACEDFAYTYWRAGTVRLVVTNTTNNFGEMQGPSKYPTMIQRALWNGQAVRVHTHAGKPGSRYYLHSEQTADAVLHILTLPVPVHELGAIDSPARYHIAGTDAVDNLELAELTADAMGLPLSWEKVDCHEQNPAHDIHYGIQPDGVPGWSPKPFLPYLERTCRWHMEHPEWLS